jgi:hypothetical protein
LLAGQDSPQRVRPIKTGIKAIDRIGLMEVVWYTQQLKRIALGGNPLPNASALGTFLKSFIKSGWGNYRSRRMRA